jgi:hypothetical protein
MSGRIPNLTIPSYRALVKVAIAGIGHPGTTAKAIKLVRWGLIRRVPNTGGKYEITARGVAVINKAAEGES